MNSIDRLAEKLADFPHICYKRTSDSITVEPVDKSGFVVELRLNGDGFTVSYEGWHEEFSSESDAFGCFRFGLSSSCRLAVTYRGSFPTKWAVEYKEGDKWVTDSETGLLLFPFWRRKRIVYKQNNFVSAIQQACATDAGRFAIQRN